MSQQDKIFCPLRKIWLKALPEEKIRINLLIYMIDQLGYPMSHIFLEKGLKQLPHLFTSSISLPLRRADIIVYAPEIHPDHALYPLLLIECKAFSMQGKDKLADKVKRQVIGYNQFVGAYFIGIADFSHFTLGFFDSIQQKYSFLPFIPPYAHLIQLISQQSLAKEN